MLAGSISLSTFPNLARTLHVEEKPRNQLSIEGVAKEKKLSYQPKKKYKFFSLFTESHTRQTPPGREVFHLVSHGRNPLAQLNNIGAGGTGREERGGWGRGPRPGAGKSKNEKVAEEEEVAGRW